jgi:hypothetical protein
MYSLFLLCHSLHDDSAGPYEFVLPVKSIPGSEAACDAYKNRNNKSSQTV